MVRVPMLVRVLSVLTALAMVSGCTKSERYSDSAPPDASTRTPNAKTAAGIRYAKPALDLPPERLSERVDGAEVKLRSLGCRRLRLWRLQEPLADLELLSFADERGASRMLTEEAGPDRSPNAPGDEGWIGANVLYFRSKAMLVRLIADGPESASAMLVPARRMEQALRVGEVAP